MFQNFCHITAERIILPVIMSSSSTLGSDIGLSRSDSSLSKLTSTIYCAFSIHKSLTFSKFALSCGSLYTYIIIHNVNTFSFPLQSSRQFMDLSSSTASPAISLATLVMALLLTPAFSRFLARLVYVCLVFSTEPNLSNSPCTPCKKHPHFAGTFLHSPGTKSHLQAV